MLLAWSSAADASSQVYTRGDAEAVFNGFINGGWAIRLHSPTWAGAPADGGPGGVAIRPFGGSGWNGEHICASDYHVFLIANFDGPGPGYNEQWKKADVAAYLATVGVQLMLDGSPMATKRTPVKPFLNPQYAGLWEAWGVVDGRIMAPGELTLGMHSFTILMTDPIWGNYEDGIFFFVDPPGSPSCSH